MRCSSILSTAWAKHRCVPHDSHPPLLACPSIPHLLPAICIHLTYLARYASIAFQGALATLRSIIKDEGLGVNMNPKKGGRSLLTMAEEIDRERDLLQTAQTESAITAALKAVAVQVRVIGPQVGIGKGMLMRKPGIKKIQLPPSMVKVGPSRCCDDDWVCLVVKNVFPSTVNTLVSRALAGDELSASARKELENTMSMRASKNRQKPGIVMRLMSALGVPDDVMKAYENKSPEEATHTWVVGGADPTNSLPAGHIFVTGLTPILQSSGLNKLFVTRSPCILPSHGRMLPVVTQRPSGMASATWDWLLTLPIGAVLFSGEGDVEGAEHGLPLPSTIADGDLDGDLYFVCWDVALTRHIRPRELPGDEEEDRRYPAMVAADTQRISKGREWLSEVQEKLRDLSIFGDQRLVGRLYNEMLKRFEKHGMDNVDVQALGVAYTQGLMREKQGCAIELPRHLHKTFI